MAIESVKQAVGAAIQRASEATGVDFGFLMRTAARESGYNPAAKAASSSAAGLYQFVEQTWLGALKRHGAKYGYGDYADLIQGSGEGRLSVAGSDAKKAVMALRLDPRAASLMAGELASDNSAYLRGRVGRDPTAGELYAAHFLGPRGSGDLIEAHRSRPGASAAALFPDAAAANPSIFYRDGRSASVAEVYANLTGGRDASIPASATPEPESAPAFLHHNIQARMARIEQERQLANLILGINPDNGGGGFFGARTGGGLGGSSGSSRGLTGALLNSEMLTLLSQARQGGGKA
jgi:hypothetical protein